MRQHVTVLGVLYIVVGSLVLIFAVVVLLVLGGSAGIVGIAARDDPGAQIAVPILGGLAAGLFVLIAIMSTPGIVAGVGLVRFRPWARILAIILSVVNLLFVPVGTILGIYGLWVLLPAETEQLFRGLEPPSRQPAEPGSPPTPTNP